MGFMEYHAKVAEHSESLFQVIVSHEEMLFEVQSAYFLVIRHLLGYTPKKDLRPCHIARRHLMPMENLTLQGMYRLGPIEKGQKDVHLYFGINCRNHHFEARLIVEMMARGMTKLEASEIIGMANMVLLCEKLHERYGADMLAYAKQHKGNRGLPSDWQALIKQ